MLSSGLFSIFRCKNGPIKLVFYLLFTLHLLPMLLKVLHLALAGVAQWIVCLPANQRVVGSIPGQGTCLGCRPPGGQVPSRGAWEATTN